MCCTSIESIATKEIINIFDNLCTEFLTHVHVRTACIQPLRIRRSAHFCGVNFQWVNWCSMVDTLGLLQLHPSQFPAQVQRGQGACLVTTPRGCHWAESRSGKAKTSRIWRVKWGGVESGNHQKCTVIYFYGTYLCLQYAIIGYAIGSIPLFFLIPMDIGQGFYGCHGLILKIWWPWVRWCIADDFRCR